MSTSITHTPRRVLAGLLAVALALTGVVLSAAVANAAEATRVFGDDRYATSVAVSDATFDSATDVIVARGDGTAFADALAASGVAGAVTAPVLLTDIDEITQGVLDEIVALDPTTVHIAGGTAAVSQGVEDAIDAATDADINRFAGENRYDTAALMGAAIGADNVGELGGLPTAIIARGDNFPDALAGGPIAYAGVHPILLVETDSVPEETTQALTDLGIEQVVILGETAAVSAEVETELETQVGNDAVRLGGDTRFETAVAIADAATASFGFDTDNVILARADLAADALSGGPHGGEVMSPILLTNSDSLADATSTYLAENAPATITVLGGPAAISDDVVDAAVAAAESVIQETTYEVALSWVNEYRESTMTFRNGEPGATGTATVTLDPDTDTVEFDVDYSEVTGPFDGGPGFHIHEGGVAEEGGIVVTLATGAELEADPDQVLTGTVTTDDDADLGDVIDEILTNADDYYLNLHSDAYPAGAIRGQLPDGGQDEIPAADTGTVTAVNTGADTYDLLVDGASAARTITYTGDQFTVGGAGATIGAFEAALSAGDTIAFSAGDDADDAVNLHALTNGEQATSGTVGNVDTAANSFDIIATPSGVVLNSVADYSGSLYTVGTDSATVGSFEDEISEGDTVSYDPDAATTTYALTNGSVSGSVTDLTIVANTSTTFQVDGTFGDVPTGPENANFVATAAADGTTQEFTVDGEDATYAEFEAAISAEDDAGTPDVVEGADDVTYSRTGGVETFALTDNDESADPDTPETFSGEGADDLVAADDTFTLVTADGPESIDYTDAADVTFTVDTEVATEGEFEAAYDAGDAIVVTEGVDDNDTPDDTSDDTIIVTGIDLTNQDLSGEVGDVDVTADATVPPVFYEVEGPDGETTLTQIDYTAGATSDRYYVDDTEVNQATFETALTTASNDDTATITYLPGDLATEHRLDTDGS